MAKTGERVLFCFEPLRPTQSVPWGEDWEDTARHMIPAPNAAAIRGSPGPVPPLMDRILNTEQAKRWIIHNQYVTEVDSERESSVPFHPSSGRLPLLYTRPGQQQIHPVSFCSPGYHP